MDIISAIIYILYGIISVGIAYVAQKNNSKIIAGIAYLIVVLFWGFRCNIGFDYDGYVQIFDDIRYGQRSYVEIGYYYLNYIFSPWGNGYIGTFFLASAVTFFFLFKAFWERKILWQGLFFSLALQFQFMAANQVRQAIAIAIFLYILNYLENRSYLKFVIGIICIVFAFHTSAICLLFAIPLSRIRLNKIIWTIILVATYFLYLKGYFVSLGNYLFEILPIPERYTAYLLGDRVNPEQIGFSLVQLSNVLIGLYLLWNEKYILSKSLLPVFLAGLVAYMVFIEYHLFLRMSFYFVYSNIILASLLCSRSPKKGFPLVVFCGLLFVLICLQSSNMHGVLPYQSWFFKY